MHALHAAAPARDDTGNYPTYQAGDYAGAWPDGSNGGSGLAPWRQSVSSPGAPRIQAGFEVEYASFNGGQPDNYQPTIDVQIGSWGLYANSGQTAAAMRPFTAGGANNSAVLGAGQALRLSMDNGYVNESGGGVVGFGLQNAAGQNRLEFYFVGGRQRYTLNLGGVETDTGIPFSVHGFDLVFTQGDAAGAFTLAVHPLDAGQAGGDRLFTGALAAADVTQLRLFDFNSDPAGNGVNSRSPYIYDVMFNRLEITGAGTVPEPGSATLALAVGAAALLGTRMGVRRREV